MSKTITLNMLSKFGNRINMIRKKEKKIPIVFSREDIEWIKSPLDFGRKGEK
jgi:hypothetical protein